MSTVFNIGIEVPEKLVPGYRHSEWRVRIHMTRRRWVSVVAGTRKECMRLATLIWSNR